MKNRTEHVNKCSVNQLKEVREISFTKETPSSSWMRRPLALSELASFSVKFAFSADNLALS